MSGETQGNSFNKPLGFEIDQSCIDLATQELQKDRGGQVIWFESHAYFIPSSAGEDDMVANVPIRLKAGERTLAITLPPRKVSELRASIDGEGIRDITNLLKRLITQ